MGVVLFIVGIYIETFVYKDGKLMAAQSIRNDKLVVVSIVRYIVWYMRLYTH